VGGCGARKREEDVVEKGVVVVWGDGEGEDGGMEGAEVGCGFGGIKL
jgi:hypothetical protein